MNRRVSVATLALLVLLALLLATGCQFTSLPHALGFGGVPAVAQAQAAEPTAVPEEPVSLLTSDALAVVESALMGIYKEVSPSVVYVQVWVPTQSPFGDMLGSGTDTDQVPL